MSSDPAGLWPLFGLRLRHGDLELRTVTDTDAAGLAGIVEAGHERFMPTLLLGRAGTTEERARLFLQYHWGVRARLARDDWRVPFAVHLDGVLVGLQAASAMSFDVIRDVHTGSYLARAAQGRKIGTRMRSMVVEWAFAHLGALSVSSGYHEDNHRSAGVSARLGYQPDGVVFEDVEGRRDRVQRVRLYRQDWPAHRPRWLDEMTVDGLESCRHLLSARPAPAAG